MRMVRYDAFYSVETKQVLCKIHFTVNYTIPQLFVSLCVFMVTVSSLVIATVMMDIEDLHAVKVKLHVCITSHILDYFLVLLEYYSFYSNVFPAMSKWWDMC